MFNYTDDAQHITVCSVARLAHSDWAQIARLELRAAAGAFAAHDGGIFCC
jgi:hypothetical protein